MEPDMKKLDYAYKENQRKKNVKEYQDKFFKKITKNKYQGKRV